MFVCLVRALLLVEQILVAAAANHGGPRGVVANRGFASGGTTCWWSCPSFVNGWAFSGKVPSGDHEICQYTIPFPPGGTLSCYYFVEFGTLFQAPSGVQCQSVPNAPFAGCGPDFAPTPDNPNFKKRKLRRGAKRDVRRDVLVH
ncbi:hypothetical protein JCM24511_06793 [Saitozyma sp. JCM 24511]|nr:hypothetical protein JCM24511_06793 [Saitozyma sp. JCM 24511]